MYNTKRSWLLVAALTMACISMSASATNKTCDYGGKYPNCNPKPEDPKPPVVVDPGNSNENTNTQGQGQTQGQSSNATGGNGFGGTGGTGVGLGVGTGGAGGDGGNATGGSNKLGDVGSNSAALSGSASGVSDSGNSASLSNATGGSVGDTSSASSSGALSGSTALSGVGDTSARSNVGDTSNTTDVANGSSSLSGASNGNQSTSSTTSDSTVNNIDASDRSGGDSYTSQALFLPSIANAAPALVTSPAVTTERSECGPRVRKVTSNVSGTYVGIIKRSSIDLGVDDELVQADEPYRYWTDPNGVQHVFGHQLLTAITVNGVAASRSLGLGGGETGGSWGQAGVSSGSSIQRTIVRVQVRECELPLVKREAPRILTVEENG